MKRSYVIHLFICFGMGAIVGIFLLHAIQDFSILYGVLSSIAIVASILVIIYGPYIIYKKK